MLPSPTGSTTRQSSNLRSLNHLSFEKLFAIDARDRM